MLLVVENLPRHGPACGSCIHPLPRSSLSSRRIAQPTCLAGLQACKPAGAFGCSDSMLHKRHTYNVGGAVGFGADATYHGVFCCAGMLQGSAAAVANHRKPHPVHNISVLGCFLYDSMHRCASPPSCFVAFYRSMFPSSRSSSATMELVQAAGVACAGVLRGCVVMTVRSACVDDGGRG